MHTQLLEIQPDQLKFKFKVNKQISCAVHLANATDQFVAFKVRTTSPMKYCVRPNVGIIMPRSTCDITVTMQAQKSAPPEMQYNDKFLIQSTVVQFGTSKEEITHGTFVKDNSKHIEEVKLRVALTSVPSSPENPLADVVSKQDPMYESSSPKEVHCPVLLTGVIKQEPSYETTIPKLHSGIENFPPDDVVRRTMYNQLLEIQPRELKFKFEVKKQSSCAVHLANATDQYVAFKVKTTSQKKYCVRPNAGIIKPKSTCDCTVTMQAQKSALPEMQCNDKFLIQSTVVQLGASKDDITPGTFVKDNSKHIEEVKLRVALTSVPSSPENPLADVVSKQDPMYESSSPKEVHSPVLLTGVIKQEPSYETTIPKLHSGIENFPPDDVVRRTMYTQLLEIQPRELKFKFEVKKQSSCAVHLANATDQYVAFKVKTTSQNKYCVRPNAGIIKPKSTCDCTVTMQAQKSAPPEMQCNDKFLIQSTVVQFGTSKDEITPGTFVKDNSKHIEEVKLRVALTSVPSSPENPLADVVSKQEPVYESSSPKEVQSPVLLPVNGVIKQQPSYETTIPKLHSGTENFPPDDVVTQLLEIQPRELKFEFELKKQISCAVNLANATDQFVAFKVKTTSVKKYCVKPNVGIINPKSMCNITVTMQAQKSAPPEMQCNDKFLIQSTIVQFGTSKDEITRGMFLKDKSKHIEDVKLRVALTSVPSSPENPQADVVSKQGTIYEPLLPKEVHAPGFLGSIIISKIASICGRIASICGLMKDHTQNMKYRKL